MQVIYTKPKKEGHFNEEAFSVAPGETVMLVKTEKETINQMKKRSNFSTRACNKYIAVVLYTNIFNHWTVNVPEDICIEEFLEKTAHSSQNIHTWRDLATLATHDCLLYDAEKTLLNIIKMGW